MPRPANGVLALMLLLAGALLIAPLPALALDALWAVLLALSFGIAVLLLGAPPLGRVAAFPSLLLLVTVLRLTLTLATARAILGNAPAGQLVPALGTILVRGNVWVGWAVLVAIVVAQLAVFLRGNERLAEVRARFALDALPGRQMAIDADLKSGTLQPAQAREERRRLGAEGELFGALDGAMKFARGEQIALIAIVVFGVAGGVGSAVLGRGGALSQAFERASVLGIGVALLAELSAFACALGTGVLLTRAADQQGTGELGEQLGELFAASPRALTFAGLPLLLLALLPGAPHLLLLVLGCAALALAWTRRAQPGVARATSQQPAPAAVRPWSLRIGTDLTSQQAALTAGCEALHQHLAALGVPLPACVVFTEASLAPTSAVLSVRDVPLCVLQHSQERPVAVQLQACRGALLEQAPHFLGIGETQALLDGLDAQGAATALHVVPKLISVPTLCGVLQRLLADGVSIRDLKTILEALAQEATAGLDAAALAERIRPHLRRTLTHLFVAGRATLSVITLEPDLEDLLRGAVSGRGKEQTLALSPAAARDVVAAIQDALQAAASTHPQGAALLTSPQLRPLLRELLRVDLPELVVLSAQDLLPQTRVEAVGSVGLSALP
jgi:type III secretion protein V